MSAPVTVAVSLRPSTEADLPLLRELFAQSREDLAMFPDELRAGLIDMQYRSREKQYAAARPQAHTDIIVADGVSVGSLTLDESGPRTWVVDLSVLVAHRRRGIATAAMQTVLAAAARRSAATGLHVWSANHAARVLYERLGLEYQSTGEGYLEMVAVASQPGGPQ